MPKTYPADRAFMRFALRLSSGLAVLALAMLCATESAARDLVSKIAELEKLPPPVATTVTPNEPNMLFFLQRSTNANTIIYAANLAKPGQIDPKKPLDIFWRVYANGGYKSGLTFFERTMAYGSSPKPVAGRPNEFDASIVSLPEIKFRMVVGMDGKPEAIVQMGGKPARLVYAYVKVDESGLLPKLIYLDLYGIDKASGRVLHEHMTER